MGGSLSGVTAHQLGYAGHFALAFVLSVIALAAVAMLFPSASTFHRDADFSQATMKKATEGIFQPPASPDTPRA